MATAIRSEDAVWSEPGADPTGRRLLVLLHGRGADEQDLLPVAAELALDDLVVSLRGPFLLGPGFAWASEPVLSGWEGIALDDAATAVLRWLDELPGRPSAVRLLGFSQGGALAVALLRRAPERLDRVVVLSGFVAAEDREPAGPRVPVLFAYGDADPVIPREVFEAGAEWLRRNASATVRRYAGLVHAIDGRELTEARRFLT